MSITFFIHLAKKLSDLNRGCFSSEEIRDYALEYYYAYNNSNNEYGGFIMSSLIEEVSSFSELDYYTNLLTK